MSSADPSRREESMSLAAALREKWLPVALSTGPGDREAAQAAARELYRRVGLHPPVANVWLDSPFEGIVAATVFMNRHPGWHIFHFDDILLKDIDSALTAWQLKEVGLPPPPAELEPLRVLCTRAVRVVSRQLREQFPVRRVMDTWSEMEREVEVGEEALTPERLQEEIFVPLLEKLLRRMPPTVKAVRWRRLLERFTSLTYAEQFIHEYSFRNMPGDRPDGFGFGTLNAWRLAVCEQTLAERGLGDAGVLAALSELSRHCGWWWPLRQFVVFTERPSAIGCEESGRLHSLDGPALAYPDGWKLYAWRGMEVPGDIIDHREQLTVERIEAEENVELRRTLIEMYGQERFLLDSGAHAVHEDEFGTLYWLEMLYDEPLVMVKVRNSTPEPDGHFKDYFLRVPPHVETAREAVAWTFGLEPSDYGPSVET
jgi:hypothetical protein